MSKCAVDLTLQEMRLIDYALTFYYLRAEKGALEPVRANIAALHEKFTSVFIPERERTERLKRARKGGS